MKDLIGPRATAVGGVYQQPASTIGSQDADVVELVHTAFTTAAARAGGVIERRFSLAGLVVNVRFAGPLLVPALCAALTHLRVESTGPADLTLNVWDVESTSTLPPALFPEAAAEEPRAGAPLRNAGGTGSYYHYDGELIRVAYQPSQRALSLLDENSENAWYCFGDGSHVPYWERAAPFRQIFNWWLGSYGFQQVHGGAVGTPDGAVLLVGRSGSGKSTTSLCALRAGLQFAGDDYVLVRAGPTPSVYGMYCSAKLNADHLQNFPDLWPAVGNRDQLDTEKGLLFVTDLPGASVAAELPLRAVALPTIVPRSETSVVPVSKVAALTALAPSTVIQLHTAGQPELQRMSALVRQLPTYRLEIGSNLDDIGIAISRFLQSGTGVR